MTDASVCGLMQVDVGGLRARGYDGCTVQRVTPVGMLPKDRGTFGSLKSPNAELSRSQNSARRFVTSVRS